MRLLKQYHLNFQSTDLHNANLVTLPTDEPMDENGPMDASMEASTDLPEIVKFHNIIFYVRISIIVKMNNYSGFRSVVVITFA